MNPNFIVNISSIDDFASKINNESLKLEEILDSLIYMTNDMNVFFDTPSANTLQEELLHYLKNSKIPCQNLNELSNKIVLFNKNYKNIYEITQASVGGSE